MPADVAVRPPASHLAASPSCGLLGGGGWEAGVGVGAGCGAEEASGRMTLVGPHSQRQEVLARVYRTSLEHFAVLYPAHKSVCRPLGVLNLRNTRVEALGAGAGAAQRGFTVRPRAPDAPFALTFLLAGAEAEAGAQERWLRAFAWRGSPALHATPLPAVIEDDEC